jgi:hypothetical protein
MANRGQGLGEDLLLLQKRITEYRQQYISTLTVAKHYLGCVPEEIERMKLKNYYMLLRTKHKEEMQKRDYLNKQNAENDRRMHAQAKEQSKSRNMTPSVSPSRAHGVRNTIKPPAQHQAR